MILVHRCRHADEHRVGLGKDVGSAGERQALGRERLPQALLVGQQQVRAAFADVGEAAFAHVDPDHVEAGARERDSGRKADVPEPHDSDGLQRRCGATGCCRLGRNRGPGREPVQRIGLRHDRCRHVNHP